MGTSLEPSFPIVGVGASAGGLEAFTQLVKHLPLDTGMAFVLVQHLDPQHESALTQILTRATSIPVHEVTNNLRIEPDNIYIIPPNASLSIADGVLKLHARKQTAMPQHSIDTFFESLAQDRRERSIGVVLSGAASDGTLGLEAIKAEGGITFAQDDSAKYDSMPKSAVAAGCVDLVLSPAGIAKELARIAKHPYVVDQPAESAITEDDRYAGTAEEGNTKLLPSGGHGRPKPGAKEARAEADQERGANGPANGFKRIVLLLRNHSRIDFSLYKSTTIQRRILRRMVLSKQGTLSDYAHFLRGNGKELDALYSDVLISVTSFFRNPEAFDVLKRTVFPKLLQRRGDDPLRIWVLGCSTGQEAYSIAMTFAESAEKSPRARKLQIFATDLNGALLDKARHGLYSKTLVQDVSPERLRRFFVEEEGGYRVAKSLREMVVFARQNLIDDPPFSRMDLISCRNLLIYLEPSVQRKAIPTFHYALKPEGFLFLGASESIGRFTDLFEPADKKYKIYSKKAATTPAFHFPVPQERGARPPTGRPRRAGTPRLIDGRDEAFEDSRGELNAQREADRITVNQFAPPGVLVNAALQILQFRGTTSAYLEPPIGKATLDVLKMAREGLMLPLRVLLEKAKKENKVARQENVQVKQNGGVRTVNVEVIPLKNLRERCFLILFEEPGTRGRSGKGPPPATAIEERSASKAAGDVTKEKSRRVSELERELSETRDYLQAIQEQHEAANEELQASHEEVQSANEELQSLNEELETSKEELESANEELTTVNEEMAHRNAELSRLNSDLVNLQSSIKLAVLVIGRDLAILRFSPQAEKQFHLIAADIGRPIGGLRHNLRISDLPALIVEVIDTVRDQLREVQDETGHWYSLQVRPYMTVDKKVEGAILVLFDIDERKKIEGAVAASRDYAQNVIETVREPLLVLDAELRVESANRSFYRTFLVAPVDTIGRSLFDLGNRQWMIPRLQTLREEVVQQKRAVEDYEVEHEFPELGRRTMLLNARQIEGPGQPATRILLAIEDVTERKRSQLAIAERESRLRAIFDTAADGIITFGERGVIDRFNTAAERMFGYSREEAIGQHVGIFIPLLHGEEHDVSLSRYLGGSRELSARHKRGSTFPIELAISEQQDGTGRSFTGIVRDISERKELQRELLTILSEEQRRIGHDLHDSVGQNLTALGLLADNLAEMLQKRAPEEAEMAERITSGLKQSLGHIRKLSKGLLPVELDAEGLKAALAELAETTTHNAAIQCDFECDEPVRIEDNETATHLYRIAQEAVANALKHGHPGRIRISLSAADRQITLCVRDNGKGMSSAAWESEGMGLKTMQYRAGLIGATLSITPIKNGGTSLSCCIVDDRNHGKTRRAR